MSSVIQMVEAASNLVPFFNPAPGSNPLRYSVSGNRTAPVPILATPPLPPTTTSTSTANKRMSAPPAMNTGQPSASPGFSSLALPAGGTTGSGRRLSTVGGASVAGGAGGAGERPPHAIRKVAYTELPRRMSVTNVQPVVTTSSTISTVAARNAEVLREEIMELRSLLRLMQQSECLHWILILATMLMETETVVQVLCSLGATRKGQHGNFSRAGSGVGQDGNSVDIVGGAPEMDKGAETTGTGPAVTTTGLDQEKDDLLVMAEWRNMLVGSYR
ncbi:hypothetical protein HK102_001422 [Quaeritorhiza haematococci]|nr:hypothetical protein HK102_001422 [Quaeritorhiza haematococci]